MVYWKKAQLDASNLVKILLFLAVAFVIILFFTGFIDISKKSADDGTCRISVVLNNNLKTFTFGKDSISLKCPRKTIQIDNDKVQYMQADNKWKDTKIFSAKLSSDKNQFYKVAADEMGDCWYKMGEGKLNVFNKDFAAFGDTYYRTTCLICGEIRFDRSQISLGTSGEFFDYLQTHNYTRNGINKKYYDYMLMEYPAQLSPKLLDFYFRADNSIYVYGFENNPQLSTSDQYVIFFKALKFSTLASAVGEEYKDLFRNDKSFFRADDNYYIFFARPEIVPKVCEIIVN